LKRTDTVTGFVKSADCHFACPPKRSGNGQRAAEWKGGCSRGATVRRNHCPATASVGRLVRSPSEVPCRTASAYTRCARTCTNGAAIGIRQIIILPHRSITPLVRITENDVLPAEAPGVITSKSPAVPPAPAFRHSFNMPTMDFESRAMLLSKRSFSGGQRAWQECRAILGGRISNWSVGVLEKAAAPASCRRLCALLLGADARRRS
jgi:hypothetical protein